MMREKGGGRETVRKGEREGGREEGRYLDKGVGRVGIFGVEVKAGAFDDFDGWEEGLEA